MSTSGSWFDIDHFFNFVHDFNSTMEFENSRTIRSEFNCHVEWFSFHATREGFTPHAVILVPTTVNIFIGVEDFFIVTIF